jgi:hypothetical protein
MQKKSGGAFLADEGPHRGHLERGPVSDEQARGAKGECHVRGNP